MRLSGAGGGGRDQLFADRGIGRTVVCYFGELLEYRHRLRLRGAQLYPDLPNETTAPDPAAPGDFVGGQIVECRTTEPATPGTGTIASPVPVATCVAGTDDATKVQTLCPMLIDTVPKPVEASTCVPTVGLPTGPSYVKTICDVQSNVSTVMGCGPVIPVAPLWQTVTCADDGTGTKNTLADVAAYYYKTDLRTEVRWAIVRARAADRCVRRPKR